MPKLISIVMPVFNEENNIHRAYDRVVEVLSKRADQYNFEIVFTDNHSTDRTFELAKDIALKDPRVRVVRFTRNFGFNKSLLTGYRLARGDAAIQLDCDLQDDPGLFNDFLKLWEAGHDVVIGAREKREESFLLQKMRKVFYRFLHRISDDKPTIDGGDFRLIDRSIMDQLKRIYDANPYVRGLIASLAKNQIAVPYVRQVRKHDKSKFPIPKLIGLAIEGVTSHSILPLRIASYAGFAMGIFAMLLACIYFVGRTFFDTQWPAGFTAQVILTLVSMSLNSIFLGILGEYLGKIHRQIHQRPLTVVESSVNVDPEVEATVREVTC